VRELENLIERMVLLARKDRIDAEDLPKEIAGVKRPPRDAILELVGTPSRRRAAAARRDAPHHRRQQDAGRRALGIDVRTVARKLERREDDQTEGPDRS
jgi:DNA-binding NtrC family response regulator